MTLLAPPPARPNRLTYDDDLFLRTRRVLGVPLVNQTVWRLDAPLDDGARARLDSLHTGLADGPLGRVVRLPRVPGARPRWVGSTAARPLVVETAPVAPDAVLAWADRAAGTDLDPEHGPAWELRSAPLADGGTLLSYLTSHVLADGGLHVGAVTAAVHGEQLPRLPAGDVASQAPWRDDARDAAHQLRRAGAGAVRAWRQRGSAPAPTDAQQSSDTPPRTPAPGDDAPYAVPTVVVDCDAAAWQTAADRAGGSANTLLIAITVETLLACGRAVAGRPVRVAVPVSLRGPADLRSNATSGVSVTVPTEPDGRVSDLAAVRDATRTELAARAAGTRHDPLEPVKPLLQVLPDRVVARLARDNAAPLCLCSNLGTLDGGFAAPLGTPAASVLMRSVTQGASRGVMRRTRGGLSSWWSRHGDVATLSVVCLDPDLADADRLRAAVLAALGRWEVPGRAW